MKTVITTYPELKKYIGRDEKVTMKGALMNANRLLTIPIHDIKLMLSQGYFSVEIDTGIIEKPAIEGEFIGKGDEPSKRKEQADNARNMFWAQQQAMGQQNAMNAGGRQQAAAQGDIYGLGGVAAAFGRGY